MFGDGDNGWLQQMRRDHYPAEHDRVPAHLTLFRQLPPSLEAELGSRLAEATAIAPPRALLAGVADLGGGTALRVESAELEHIRAGLADSFHGLLTPQDAAPWWPHVTIQNKVKPKEARQFQAALRDAFRGRPLHIKGLASWWYRQGEWEPLKTHMFRR